MGSMSVWHWVVVLLVIVLLFGAKKIPELARGLGSGIKTFKKELDSDDDKKDDAKVTQTQASPSAEKPALVETKVVETQTTTQASSQAPQAPKSDKV